jgi:hypothetical protein
MNDAEARAMKRAFCKTAFVTSVVVVWLVLLFPAMAAFEALLPARRGPDGLYRNGDTTGLAIIAVFACLWVADRIIASLFQAARVADNRWSVSRSPKSWALR